MSEPLKPCPFCGSSGYVQEDSGRFYVSCANLDCGCCYGEAWDSEGIPVHQFIDEASAIEAWNTRAPTVATGEEVERLREALAAIAAWCCPVLCRNCASNRETARAALADGKREAPPPEIDAMIHASMGRDFERRETLSPPEGVGEDQVERECPSSPTGRHIIDTSMESGPNNCFHCERSMPRREGSA